MLTFIPVAIYLVAILVLSIYGAQTLLFALLFLYHRYRSRQSPSPEPEQWPAVTVQLPVYNEKNVIERLIDTAVAFDYPPDKLSIQVLDDSTDETTRLAGSRVELHRAIGVDIELIHRSDRSGYKAGALAAGQKTAKGELVAIFDADFKPGPDFLRRMVPYLAADGRLGMVQARWGYLNRGASLLTRSQALFLDGHFVVEQNTRSQSGLLFNFNGSAGVWRKACIEDAGGWQGDTLSEDLDLSYRAQMKGWKFRYISDVVAPAEVPPLITAFKQQQYRWAHGAIRVLRKLVIQIWHSPTTFTQRLGGTLHLSAYLIHPMLLLLLLASLPLVLSRGAGIPSMKWLSILSLGPPAIFSLSQWAIYPDWKRRLLVFPVLMMLGVGIAFNNTLAILAALGRKPAVFYRTPKFHQEDLVEGERQPWRHAAVQADWTCVVEVFLALYSIAVAVLARHWYPPLVPLLVQFALGFGYVGILGLWQSRHTRPPALRKEKQYGHGAI